MPYKYNPFTSTLDFYKNSAVVNGYHTETFTLSGTDITNKYVTLAIAPTAVTETILIIKNSPGQFYGDDFVVTTNQLGWNGLSIDGILSAGDKITVLYK